MFCLLFLSLGASADQAGDPQDSDSDVCLLALSQSRSRSGLRANGTAAAPGVGRHGSRRTRGPEPLEAGRSRGTCGVLWFLHVPRTAGSSYAAYLRDRRELDAFWEFGSPEKPARFEAELKPKMDTLVADPRGRLVAVHHRSGAPGMHELLPVLLGYRERLEERGCHLLLSTVLRSPDGWLESMLSSGRAPAGAVREAEARTLLGTREYENGEIRFILNNAPTVPEAYPLPQAVDEAALERAREILEAFDAVGFTETFDKFVRKVDGMVHLAHSRVPYLNKTPLLEAKALSSMPADITALAHARASKDWALYAELRERAAQGKRQLSLLASAPATTFCFMVIRPNSYEEELLRAAMNDGGFPACTELRVYSNVSSVAGQPAIPAVAGSMDVQSGGEYMCALNTPIFIQVYRRMFQEGAYKDYDWVVKIDADSVINDLFLQRILDRVPNALGPLVLNNAEHDGPLGLKGALIAVTSAALSLYAQSPSACEEGVSWTDKSEDWYLGICLIDVLRVPVRFEPQLVKQLGNAGPALCNNATHAVFHPLKAADEFDECKKRLKTPSGFSLRALRRPNVAKFGGQMPSILGAVETFFAQPAEWAAESLKGISRLLFQRR